MVRRLTAVSAILTVLAALLALMLAAAVPAQAHHKDGHDQGKASKSADHEGSDHDGDADSDPNTAQEDSHEAEEGVDDNRHPSGKDRSEEKGGSGNQGKSESDPDGDSNGGRDKPGGLGGLDEDDQDGNNGCGNDDDFEDDNNGNCGGKKEQEADVVESDSDEKAPCDADATMAGVQPCEESSDEVGDDAEVAPPEDDVLGVSFQAAPEVKGLKVGPGVRGARTAGRVLPFTGSDLTVFIFVALGLVAAGYLMLKARRS